MRSVFVPEEEEVEEYDNLYTLSTFSNKRTATTEASLPSHTGIDVNINSIVEEKIQKVRAGTIK